MIAILPSYLERPPSSQVAPSPSLLLPTTQAKGMAAIAQDIGIEALKSSDELRARFDEDDANREAQMQAKLDAEAEARRLSSAAREAAAAAAQAAELAARDAELAEQRVAIAAQQAALARATGAIAALEQQVAGKASKAEVADLAARLAAMMREGEARIESELAESQKAAKVSCPPP